MSHKISDTLRQITMDQVAEEVQMDKVGTSIELHDEEFRAKQELIAKKGSVRPSDSNVKQFKTGILSGMTEGAVEVGLSLYIRRVGEIDTARQTFTCSFMVILSWNIDEANRKLGPTMENHEDMGGDTGASVGDDYDYVRKQLKWKPRVSFPTLLKSFLTNKHGQWRIIEAHKPPLNLTERMVELKFVMNGVFAEPLELANFPFDCQDLTIPIWAEFSANQAVIVPSKIRDSSVIVIIPDYFSEDNWILHTPVTEFTLSDASRSGSGLVYGNFVCRLKVERKSRYFLDHIIFYCSLFCVSTLCAFALDPMEWAAERIEFIFTLVLTLVAFQFVVEEKIPNVPYLTHLDMYVRGVFAFILAIALESCIVAVYKKNADMEDREKSTDYIDDIALYVAMAVLALMHIIFIWRVWRVLEGEKSKLKLTGKELKKKIADDKGSTKKQKWVFGTQDKNFIVGKRLGHLIDKCDSGGLVTPIA